MKFTKVEGCGNDFILVDQREHLNSRDLTVSEIQILCHRYYGVGADGILIITIDPKLKTPCMTIFNADASRAEMCGNGLRCVALYLKRRGYFADLRTWIKTDAGMIEVDFSCNLTLLKGGGRIRLP